MKNIEAIISEHAAELPEEAKEAIAKEVKANYKTVVEWTKKTDRIATLEQQLTELSEQAKKVEGDGEELKRLQEEIRKRDEAEEKRLADEKKASDMAAFRERFEQALEGRKFANGIVEESVFRKAWEKCSEAAGTDAKAVIEELTKDADGIWVNPQRDPKMMPNPNDITKTKSDEQANRSFLAALFGPNE